MSVEVRTKLEVLRCGECKLEGKVKLRMKEAACFPGMGTDFRAGVPSTAAAKKEEADRECTYCR